MAYERKHFGKQAHEPRQDVFIGVLSHYDASFYDSKLVGQACEGWGSLNIDFFSFFVGRIEETSLG